jgi:hypothetical protein
MAAIDLMITFLVSILASCYTLASHIIRDLELPDGLEQNKPPLFAQEAALRYKPLRLPPGSVKSRRWDDQSQDSAIPFLIGY